MGLFASFVKKRIEINSIEEIKKQMKGYSYVSFDVFDTLLKRIVPSPKSVFELIGKKIDDPSFKSIRILAERTVRQYSAKNEISLEDIYAYMDEKYSSCQELEITLEKEVSIANYWLRPIIDACKQNNQKIIAVSDMYLSKELIQELLSRAGLDVDNIFVSSSYGEQKTSGRLFQIVLKELGIEAEEVIHIGDSFRADYLGARKAGIKSLLIPRKVNRCDFFDLKEENDDTYINNFINNTLRSEWNYYYKIGYGCFGPTLYGLINWLHERAGNRKIYFFARDGYIVKQMYGQVYPEDRTEYLYVSRRSLSVPLLWKHSKFEEIIKFIPIGRFLTLGNFLKRLGLDGEKYKSLIQDTGLSLEYVIHGYQILDDLKVRKLYEGIENDVIENSKKEYLAAIAYLKSMDFERDSIVFDIGWNGSIQFLLTTLLEDIDQNIKVEGLYFGVKSHRKGYPMEGYLFNPEEKELEGKISMMIGFIEIFFLATHGSTKSYFRDQDGSMRPLLMEPEYPLESNERFVIENIHKGALEFGKNFRSSVDSQTNKKLTQNLFMLGFKPTDKTAECFGEFRFNMGVDFIKLAAPQNMFHYLFYPHDLMIDYSRSAWKCGFLKRLFYFDIVYRVFVHLGLYAHSKRKSN